jgi:hypothetical protein
MIHNDVKSGVSLPVNIQAAETIDKYIATQIARLALAGYAVHKGRSEDFAVCKYGIAEYCQDFSTLKAFSRKLGVTK